MFAVPVSFMKIHGYLFHANNERYHCLLRVNLSLHYHISYPGSTCELNELNEIY